MTENPYRRLRELTRYSQKDFAETFDFSKTTMTHIESGQYVDLSDEMVVSLGKACAERGVNAKQILKDEYNAETLQDAYHSWQSTERIQVAHLFRRSPSGQSTNERSPFDYFIEETTGSQQKFCKTLKVPAASVMRYAEGTTRTMPKAVESALVEVQFPYLAELKEMQQKWIDR